MIRLLSFFLLLVALSVSGQSRLSYEDLKTRYPDDVAVFLKRDKVITLTVEKDSLKATSTVDETILFLKDETNYSSNWRVYGSYFQQIKDLKASISTNGSGKRKSIDIDIRDKKQEGDDGIFYDDSYFYPISFPMSTAGNEANWSYREEYRDPRFFTAFYFYSSIPLLHSALSIKAPKGVEIGWHVINDKDNHVHFTKSEKGSGTTYGWTLENYRPPAYDQDGPKASYYLPQVVYYVKSYTDSKGQRRNVLSDLKDLYAIYSSINSKLDEPPAAALDSVVNGLMSPTDTELDKVSKIFYWVQDNIRYIAFEDGMRGIVPHKPNYIIEKRYGDCKDMASLIVGMLRVAGIKSYYTLIGTRDLPFKYTVTPTPVVHNHMIATYVDKDKNYYFLDGTGNYTQAAFPSAMIQGKEALIGLDQDNYEVKTVPVVPANKNSNIDSMWLSVDQHTTMGKGVMYLTGYQKINATYTLNKSIEKKIRDNITYLVEKGNNKFLLDSFHIASLHERDTPLKIDYTFHINDYIHTIDDEFYVNLNLDKTYSNGLMAATRQIPWVNEYHALWRSIYLFDIPSGYEISYLPPHAEGRNDYVSFDITYTVRGKTIILQKNVAVNTLLVQPEEFSKWNDVVRELSKAYKQSIILKKSK